MVRWKSEPVHRFQIRDADGSGGDVGCFVGYIFRNAHGEYGSCSTKYKCCTINGLKEIMKNNCYHHCCLRMVYWVS